MGTPGKNKKYSYSKIMKRLAARIIEYKLLLVILLLAVLSEAVFLTVAPFFLRNITDSLTKTIQNGTVDFSYIRVQCIILIVFYIIGDLAKWLDNRTSVTISQNIIIKLRNSVQAKLNRLPLAYIDAHPVGDILSRITNDTVSLSNTLDTTITKMISEIITIVGIIIAMLIMSPVLTLIFILMLPVSYFSMIGISKVTKPLFKKQQGCVGDINSYMNDLYSNNVLMQAFSYEDRAQAEFDVLNAKFKQIYIKSRFFSGFILPVSKLINNLAYIALCVLSGVLMLKNKISLGEFQAFLIYANMISTPINNISTNFNNFQLGLAAGERIFEFLDLEEEPGDSDAEVFEHDSIKGSVSFENVQFGYIENKLLMHDVNFTVKPGDTVAIVGPSGAGKTTLVNLLMRFYKISGGRICLDGEDAYRFTKDSTRSLFGMVLQDTWVFNGTIAENIGYGKPDATMDEIIRAAKTVQCDSIINKLPLGYDTPISSQNSALSSGELQLLSIARTIISDPAILILDEATSQVDTKTETLITEAMEKIMENRTSFIIAHRLFTIRNADMIIYMEQGDIKEVGNHAELMRQNGLYAEMYLSMSN